MDLATIILFVNDLPRMRDFYKAVIGLRVVEDSEGWVRFDAGGCTLALHQTPAAGRPAEPAPAREDAYLKVAFHAANVVAERARLIAAGARMGEVKRFGALNLCDGLDPEGNVFQVSSRPRPGER